MTVKSECGEFARRVSVKSFDGVAKNLAIMTAATCKQGSQRLEHSIRISRELLERRLPALDVARLTGAPEHTVAAMRKGMALSDGDNGASIRPGRAPKKIGGLMASPDTHLLMSTFGKVFLEAYKQRGETSIDGEDVLSAMRHCELLGANLTDDSNSRKMLLLAEALVTGEAKMATCKACRISFMQAAIPVYVASRCALSRGKCPYCRKLSRNKMKTQTPTGETAGQGGLAVEAMAEDDSQAW